MENHPKTKNPKCFPRTVRKHIKSIENYSRKLKDALKIIF